MKTGQTQKALQKKHTRPNGKQMKFGQVVIGPAGENKVLYSAVISDERCAGRGGVGAVFGWKNLKAITVRGAKKVEIADPEKTKRWVIK